MRNIHVRLACSLKAALLLTSLAALLGCADVGPMQAQIDELRLELDGLKANSQSATQNNAKAIAALSDKLDRMFKRPLAKQAAGEEPPDL
jgi:hypothetical protein